jgi:hypothetical protein
MRTPRQRPRQERRFRLEIAQLQAAIDALVPGEAVTQAQLDQLTASTTALSDADATLVADDAPPAG